MSYCRAEPEVLGFKDKAMLITPTRVIHRHQHPKRLLRFTSDVQRKSNIQRHLFSDMQGLVLMSSSNLRTNLYSCQQRWIATSRIKRKKCRKGERESWARMVRNTNFNAEEKVGFFLSSCEGSQAVLARPSSKCRVKRMKYDWGVLGCEKKKGSEQGLAVFDENSEF